MSEQYRVILGGQLQPGWTLESAAEALAKLMHCDVAKANKIIQGPPIKLKKVMTLESANTYKQKLEQAGVVCAVQPHTPQTNTFDSKPASMSGGLTLEPMATPAKAVPQSQEAPIAARQGLHANEAGQVAAAAPGGTVVVGNDQEDDVADDTLDLGSDQIKKLLKNTYALLAMTLVFSAFTAFLGMDHDFENTSRLLIFVVSLSLLGATYLTRNSVFGLVSIFAFTGWMGYWIGPIISFYLMMDNGGSIIALAAGMTAVAFFGLSGYVLLSKKDFSFMGSFLFVGLVVLIVGMLASFFINIPGLYLALSTIGVLIFSGYILYDTSEMIHGGETNYIMATVNLYLDVINLFLYLLRLLGALSGDD